MFNENNGKVKKKKSSKGQNLRVVRRDLEVLKFILEEGQVSIDMIFERFYRYGEVERKLKYLQNRMSRLNKSGYIKTHWTHDGPKKWITATKKAQAIVEGEFAEFNCPLCVYDQIRLNQFRHDKYLAQLRIMLELENDDLRWSKYSIEDHSFKVVPDAIFELKGGRYFVELENVKKSEKFIHRKVSNYLDLGRSEFKGFGNINESSVLFVCMDQKTLNSYKKFYEKHIEKEYNYLLEVVGSKDEDFDDFNLGELKKIKSQFTECFRKGLGFKFKFVLFSDLVSLYQEKGRSSEKYLCEELLKNNESFYEKIYSFTLKVDALFEEFENKIVNHEVYGRLGYYDQERVSKRKLDEVLEKERLRELAMVEEEAARKKGLFGVFR